MFWTPSGVVFVGTRRGCLDSRWCTKPMRVGPLVCSYPGSVSKLIVVSVVSVFPDRVMLRVEFVRLERAFNACCDLSRGLIWFVSFSVLAVVHTPYILKNEFDLFGLFLVLLHTFSIDERMKFSLVSRLCLYDSLLWVKNGWLSWWWVVGMAIEPSPDGHPQNPLRVGKTPLSWAQVWVWVITRKFDWVWARGWTLYYPAP